jgi:soluble lytic murein transglycosylase-like protein
LDLNLASGAVAPKIKIILVLLTAAVALTVTLLSVTGPAAAYSGGTSTSDGSGGGKYDRMWKRTSRHNKRWARHTAECESGKDPNAISGGGTYRGAFQFTKPTWHHAPKTPGGDPIKYDFHTQAVVAVKLKAREGTSAWPNCG